MEHVIQKSAAADIDYTVDWSLDLATGEAIDSSSWSVDSGITYHDASNTDTTATAFFSGGTGGVKYKAVNTIVTDNAVPRTMKKTIVIPVKG